MRQACGFGGNVYRDHDVGAQIAGGTYRYGCGQPAVDIAFPADGGGLENIGDAGGGANCLAGVAAVEDYVATGVEFGGYGGESERKALHGTVTGLAVDVVLQFFAADEAAGGKGKVNQIGALQVFRFTLHPAGVHAGRIQAADHGTGAGTGNDFDGNIVFFQHFYHADMGEAFGCTSAQCQTDNGWRFVVGLAGGEGLAVVVAGAEGEAAAEGVAGGEGKGKEGDAEAAAE